MSSASLTTWLGPRANDLDEIEAAHAAVGGSKRGRRWATEQINHAYTVLLSSQFQGFCRDLHSECVDWFVTTALPGRLHAIVRAEFLFGRRLDRGNPSPDNIDADFQRLGIDLWPQLRHADARTTHRRKRLAELGEWRNAIAHQDFRNPKLTPARIRLSTVQSWRSICGALAVAMDRALQRYLGSVSGNDPW